ncbi:uncharacterized protein K02A2.6-like [Saccostrea cucullata]|uniref:uncharacterized protein K02A2.6-like n=1 Tax=Saccostrea cuccullata TaxID=36930 RepID=UPI002ED66821
MKISEIPDLPWKAVGTDLFHWNNNNYLMVVDYYSRYFEIAKLENTKATCVINHLKSIFARHGIPQYVRSDCGPQYTSAEFNMFKKFAEEWGFTHQKSSPNYQQSNGLAERFVQSAKNMLNKAHKEGKDPYLSMLAYRNTPIEDVGSPAQLLMNRRLRSTIPATNKILRPRCVNLKTTREKIQNSKQKQKFYYDRNTKPLEYLKKNETVRIQLEKGGKWNPGKIVDNHDVEPNSFHVKTTEGAIYRRNRRHIMKTKEDFDDKEIEIEDNPEIVANETFPGNNDNVDNRETTPVVRRT